MPNLPTIFVTDEQAQRLLAAFPPASVDGVTYTSQQVYKRWLRQKLIEHVARVETSRIDAQCATDKAAAQQSLEGIPDA